MWMVSDHGDGGVAIGAIGGDDNDYDDSLELG